MGKDDFVIKTFSLIPEVQLSPIQTQKLFFLIGERLQEVCGPEIKQFDFQPYYYGPFDKDLSRLLRLFVQSNILVPYTISHDECYQLAICRVEYYQINKQKIVDTSGFFNEKIRNYIKNQLVEFVRRVSFRDLCFSIHKEFPDMAINSILVER